MAKKKVTTNSSVKNLEELITSLEEELIELEEQQDKLPGSSPERKKVNKLVKKTSDFLNRAETVKEAILNANNMIARMDDTIQELNKQIANDHDDLTKLIAITKKVARAAGTVAKHVKEIASFAA